MPSGYKINCQFTNSELVELQMVLADSIGGAEARLHEIEGDDSTSRILKQRIADRTVLRDRIALMAREGRRSTKIRLVLVRTHGPCNAWIAVKTAEVDIPMVGQEEWQVIGAEWPESEGGPAC